MARAAAAIERSEGDAGDAFLAFTGDKRFLWSETGRSFVMFAVSGRAWIAASEPIGDANELDALRRAFIKRARAARGWPAFYNVSREFADRARADGLSAEKIGERASVDLERFTISGKKNRGLRNERNQAENAGCLLEMLPPGSASAIADELHAVSDAWLAERGGVEKRFSLGRFDIAYLDRFCLAVVRRRGELIAFANIWRHAGVMTMDLMRFRGEGPGAGMNYLFMELALQAKSEGARRLDLGLAPLAGVGDEKGASAPARLGALIYRRGGRFYGFQGLRAFKDKFDPDWEDRFLVARNAWRIGAAAFAVAALTGGGLRNMLRRGGT